MLFFLIAIIAGILTVLAPCILPLLPVVIGAGEPGERRVSTRALTVILSLVASVVLFTLLLRATTFFIVIPDMAWRAFSGAVVALLGLTLVAPTLWAKVPFVSHLSLAGNATLGKGFARKSHYGNILMGVALGPVFSTCSPTYLFIIATVLPASFLVGLSYLLAFALGLGLSLLAIAYFGQSLVNYVVTRMTTAKRVKQIFGALLILVGVAIVGGYDKALQTRILDSGYGATILLEEGLIERYAPSSSKKEVIEEVSTNVSSSLQAAFPNTSWKNADPRLLNALSGGPAKDGIPSIDVPKFIPINQFKRGDQVDAIVLKSGDVVKVYPYNILVWHEIVNDTIGGVPVSVTFCPLCGSAVVFDRRLPSGTTTFGVSGHLLESNMIMYDRASETLWQQSTGEALAGEHRDFTLSILPMQRMSMGSVREAYPNALVLSEDTGVLRDYTRNPYGDYNESERLIFPASGIDARYHPKTIMVVFILDGTYVALPWSEIAEGKQRALTDGSTILVTKSGDELTLTNDKGVVLPFYFEMWFSFVSQHKESGMLAQVLPLESPQLNVKNSTESVSTKAAIATHATALLANGCFWCVEHDLVKVHGVRDVISGYAGGTTENPTYKNHTNGGHREVVLVTYDPSKVSFANLVEHIIKHGDPTDPDGSFADRGPQYAPAIYYETDEERIEARKVIDAIDALSVFDKPLPLPIIPRVTFWPAEEYHQDYAEKNPIRYNYYRNGSGRNAFIKKYWNGKEEEFTVSVKLQTTNIMDSSTAALKKWESYVKADKSTLRTMLTPLQYKVTQEDGTERAFDNIYDTNKERGIYVDILSGEPLYLSSDKYDSGTGWPSFVKPIRDDAVVLKEDRHFFSTRTEVRSRFGDNHLGHVFDDGPSDRGGKRYCMNSASLRFVPRVEMEKEGYGEFIAQLGE